MDVQEHLELLAAIDEIRGELDKEKHREPGYSGPITDSYMIGYGKHARHNQHVEREIHCNHGWY